LVAIMARHIISFSTMSWTSQQQSDLMIITLDIFFFLASKM